MVSGIVQGVSFRSYVQKAAASLGLKGWVKNLDTGHVEVMAEGNEIRIMELIRSLKKGPPMAEVEDVSVDWAECKNEFTDFRIAA
jgi:acylphosphatase